MLTNELWEGGELIVPYSYTPLNRVKCTKLEMIRAFPSLDHQFLLPHKYRWIKKVQVGQASAVKCADVKST